MLCYAKDLTLWASLLEQTVYEGEHVMTGRRDAGHKQFAAIPSATGGIAGLPSDRKSSTRTVLLADMSVVLTCA